MDAQRISKQQPTRAPRRSSARIGETSAAWVTRNYVQTESISREGALRARAILSKRRATSARFAQRRALRLEHFHERIPRLRECGGALLLQTRSERIDVDTGGREFAEYLLGVALDMASTCAVESASVAGSP